MAECENCKTWQHIVCEVGVDDESALPEPYKCSECCGPDPPQADLQPESPEPPTNGNANSIAEIEDKVRRSVAQAWLHVLSQFAPAGVDAMAKAIEIESELFKTFGCTNQPYREQFRTLSFNLKDSKNSDLQKSVLSGAMPASKFVAMTSEQLRNPELQRIADDIHKESIREAVIPAVEPPLERVLTGTAELEAVLQSERRCDEEEHAEPLKNPPALPPKTPDVQPVERPVWSGRVFLADNSIEFISSAIQVTGENHAMHLGTQIKVQGLVQPERTVEYLRASAEDKRHHRLGSVAILEPRCENSLFKYISNLQRFGSIRSSGVHVKDAFLLPWTPEFDLSFLEKPRLLDRLASEHDGKLLVVIYVLNLR